MPRASRIKAERRHAAAVQLPSKRTFAVPAEQVTEVILPGTEPQEPAAKASSSRIRKADRPPAAALVPQPPSHPYSRSHNRREKRKVQQELAGGQLHAVAAALSEVLGEKEGALSTTTKAEREAKKQKLEEDNREQAKMGVGKGRTLSEKARRKQIGLEAKRIPAVMQHPEYKKNPWATIRLHASNSVAAKEGSAVSAVQARGTKTDKMEGLES